MEEILNYLKTQIDTLDKFQVKCFEVLNSMYKYFNDILTNGSLNFKPKTIVIEGDNSIVTINGDIFKITKKDGTRVIEVNNTNISIVGLEKSLYLYEDVIQQNDGYIITNNVNGLKINELLIPDNVKYSKRVCKCVYDFNIQGGDIGYLSFKDNLENDITLENCLITNIYFNVIDSLTSDLNTGLFDFKIGANSLLLNPIVADGNTSGLNQGKADNIISNYIEDSGTIGFEISDENITSGKIVFVIEYELLDQ